MTRLILFLEAFLGKGSFHLAPSLGTNIWRMLGQSFILKNLCFGSGCVKSSLQLEEESFLFGKTQKPSWLGLLENFPWWPGVQWRCCFHTNIMIPIIFQISHTCSRGYIFLWLWAQDRVFWLESVELSKHMTFINFPECQKEKWLTQDSVFVFDALHAHKHGLGGAVGTFTAPSFRSPLTSNLFLHQQKQNNLLTSQPVPSLAPSLAFYLVYYLLLLEPFHLGLILLSALLPRPHLPLNSLGIRPFQLRLPHPTHCLQVCRVNSKFLRMAFKTFHWPPSWPIWSLPRLWPSVISALASLEGDKEQLRCTGAVLSILCAFSHPILPITLWSALFFFYKRTTWDSEELYSFPRS